MNKHILATSVLIFAYLGVQLVEGQGGIDFFFGCDPDLDLQSGPKSGFKFYYKNKKK